MDQPPDGLSAERARALISDIQTRERSKALKRKVLLALTVVGAATFAALTAYGLYLFNQPGF
jgi:hypothetical protein